MKKWILGSAVMALAIAGCGGGSGSSGTSFVMGVNTLPNGGALSITANGTLILNSAAYGTNSSAFVSVNAGTAAPVFLTNSASTQLASGTTNFTNGDYYAAYALGNTTNQFVFLYAIDVTAPTNANSGNLILVNASVLQPTVDVYVTLQGNTTPTAHILSMTPFNSGQVISNLPAGTYDVQIDVANTSTILVDQPTVVVGTTAGTNQIQIVGIADAQTGSSTAQVAAPIIPVPTVATASTPRNLGHAIVLGHPGMTTFPTKRP